MRDYAMSDFDTAAALTTTVLSRDEVNASCDPFATWLNVAHTESDDGG